MVGTAGCRRTANESAALPPGAPPAFGTAPDAGPPVSTTTFEEAEKLVQFSLSPAEREMAAGNWRRSLAPVYERRTGPRKFAPPANVAPATRWDPVLPGMQAGAARDRFVRSAGAATALPGNDAEIAFAPLWKLARWVESRQITSERLTQLYLDRIARFDP
ncbi:MAG: Amidase [Candidatus Solibacter sp.]|nr:Amidase [Candidatus Solibacter sp.]